MHPSQLGRIILSGDSSSCDEMRVNPDADHEGVDALLEGVAARAVRAEFAKGAPAEPAASR